MSFQPDEKERRINEPFNFKGDRSDRKQARHFLRLCKNYLELNAKIYNTDKSKIFFATQFLQEDPAASWSESLLNEYDTQQTYPTYATFEDDFKKAFITQNEEQEAFQALDTLKQGPDDSVITYNAQFQTLAAQAKANDFVSLQEKYLKGVNRKIAEEIIKHQPQPKAMVTSTTNGKGVYELAVEYEATAKRLEKLANAIEVNRTNKWNTQPAYNRRPFQSFQPRNNFNRNNYNRNNFNRNYTPNRNPPNYQNNQGGFNPKYRYLKKLTPQEREKAIANGECLRCREKGHIGRNCPNFPNDSTYIRNTTINESYGHNYGTIFDQQGPTIAQATTSSHNPFRTQPNKLGIVEIKAAIKELSVGEFSDLIQDIEAKADF